MFHMFSSCENLWNELSGLPHATTGGDPEDADTRAPDHLSDALRYVLAGMGAGAEYTIFNDEPAAVAGGSALAAASVDGLPVLQDMGGMAWRKPPGIPDWSWDDDGADDGPPSWMARTSAP
jgi:hypothetical protein